MIWGETHYFRKHPYQEKKQPVCGTMGLPFTTRFVAGSYDSKGYDKGSNSKGGYDSQGYIPISTWQLRGAVTPPEV